MSYAIDSNNSGGLAIVNSEPSSLSLIDQQVNQCKKVIDKLEKENAELRASNLVLSGQIAKLQTMHQQFLGDGEQFITSLTEEEKAAFLNTIEANPMVLSAFLRVLCYNEGAGVFGSPRETKE